MKHIVFEGISASGKGTLIEKIKERLTEERIKFFVTEWNSFPITTKVIKKLKKDKKFNPETWSILHALDCYLRFISLPPDTEVVIWDRFVYTALSRDTLRGLPEQFVSDLYDFLPNPDLVFYLDIDLDTAFDRRKNRHKTFYYYSSGADIYSDKDMEQSWKKYNESLIAKYNEIFN
ncbi:TPA: deoxynucleoside kinase, partial [Streptococcus suis]|nr:deoxynucleoside kinase [Streptococcus suis]